MSGEQFEIRNFSLESIWVIFILLDFERKQSWTWDDSCQQVFQECIHRVQKNNFMENVFYWKKTEYFNTSRCWAETVFEIWQKCFTTVVIGWFYLSRRNFWRLFVKNKYWSPLTLAKFLGIWHKSFATFSDQNSTCREEELEESFFVFLRIVF